MQKNYCTVNDIQIHYRIVGSGPKIVLLHPSPRSGKMLESFATILAEYFTVILPDTPGYGNSDPLPVEVTDLTAYLPYFHAFFGAMGIEKVNLYGSATGAQLAIAYGLAYPDSVAHLYLDNAAHFETHEQEAIVERYFPDFTPQPDGSHLIKLWQHLRDSFLFFPWFDYQHGKRLNTGIPPAQVLNEAVIDYLLSGKNWTSAYSAAFIHEKAEKVQALQVPSTLFKWKGGIMIEKVDALINLGLPTQMNVVETPAPILERYTKMKEVMGLDLR